MTTAEEKLLKALRLIRIESTYSKPNCNYIHGIAKNALNQFKSEPPKEKEETKPLSEITDEDLTECIRILMGADNENPNDWEDKKLLSDWKGILKLELTEGGYNFNVKPYFKHVWQVYQYLQFKGYQLPVYYPSPLDKKGGE